MDGKRHQLANCSKVSGILATDRLIVGLEKPVVSVVEPLDVFSKSPLNVVSLVVEIVDDGILTVDFTS